jgi:hypothetical protein
LVQPRCYRFPFAPGDFTTCANTQRCSSNCRRHSERLALSSDNNEPERVRSATMTDLLSLLGAQLVLGRDFGEGDAAA